MPKFIQILKNKQNPHEDDGSANEHILINIDEIELVEEHYDDGAEITFKEGLNIDVDEDYNSIINKIMRIS